jgi:hypothetical protein
MVRYCQIQQNLKLPAPAPTDPFKSYRRDEKLGWLARGLIPQRTIWRGMFAPFEPWPRSRVCFSTYLGKNLERAAL